MNHAARTKRRARPPFFCLENGNVLLPNERRKRRLDREMAPVASEYSTANGQKSRGRPFWRPLIVYFPESVTTMQHRSVVLSA